MMNAVQFAQYGGPEVLQPVEVEAPRAGPGEVPTTSGPGLVGRVRRLVPNGIDAALDLAGQGVLPDLIEPTGEPAGVLSIGKIQAARLPTAGTLRVHIDQTFALSGAAETQRTSAAGHAAGKFIVRVAGA